MSVFATHEQQKPDQSRTVDEKRRREQGPPRAQRDPLFARRATEQVEPAVAA